MRRLLATGAVLAAALALPAGAWAHAALVRTVPEASRTLNAAPAEVRMTFSEPVEPRFAIVSVTDAAAHQETAGPPTRDPADPNTIVIPLKHVEQGWYLVYWRVISVDGHPVRGAFTFAVGPNPGPAPQFQIPSVAETAATPRLVASRWVVFMGLMAAVGLFVLRMGAARPLVRTVPDTRLRALEVSFVAASALTLLAIPVYVAISTADFALRSVFDLGAIVPLLSVSAFGSGFLKLELCFALFVLAALVALWVDRPERPRRTVAALLAGTGAWLAAAAVLLVPGAAGHAGQTAPRGWALAFDWLHMAAGSIWVGGLIGLLVLAATLPSARRVAGLAYSVPRFSNVALVSVLALIGSGTGASILHLPTLASLWQTSYGQALLAKIVILAVAMLLAAVNLLRTKPRLVAKDRNAVLLLRRLVGGELLLVTGAVLAAAILTSLAPPSKALAEVGKAAARVGPGAVRQTVEANGYTLAVQVAPNQAAVPNDFTLRLTRGGQPVRGADVSLSFAMLDMEMGEQAYQLRETEPGTYAHSAPALVMVGHWGLDFTVTPPGGREFDVLLVDNAAG